MSGRKTVFFCSVLISFLFFAGILYASGGLIEKVVFRGENKKSESVDFYLNGPWLPKAFALDGDKPRVVFDFKDTRLARTISRSIVAEGEMIRQIRFGRYTNKTRVVIDLAVGKGVSFDQQFDESTNILTIQLHPVNAQEDDVVPVLAEQEHVAPLSKPVTVSKALGEETDTTKTVSNKEELEPEHIGEAVANTEPATMAMADALPESFEKKIPEAEALLIDVSFENTSNKGEMVLFKLNGFYPPTVQGYEEGPPRVVCEFSGARLGEKVVKNQVTHGEYVKHVRVEQVEGGGSLRVTLELVPDNDYDLQQVFFKEDNLFVVIVNSYDSTEVGDE